MNFTDWQEQQHITQFLHHEARLLDEHRWVEWMDLFTPDGLYWMPLVRGQTDHLNHASLFCVRRLSQVRAYSQQPATRTSHVVGNVTLESRTDGGDSDGCTVYSTFHLLEWRKDAQRAFGGSVLHTLQRDGDSFRIRMKRVDLLNCDAPHEALEVFM